MNINKYKRFIPYWGYGIFFIAVSMYLSKSGADDFVVALFAVPGASLPAYAWSIYVSELPDQRVNNRGQEIPLAAFEQQYFWHIVTAVLIVFTILLLVIGDVPIWVFALLAAQITFSFSLAARLPKA